jgi:Fic-DOC domain mobile mystery protein B
MKFTQIQGATPIDMNSAQDLIPPLTSQEQLNEFEQANITIAMEWALKSRKLKSTLLSPDGLASLHRKMFDQTWRWAGKFRRHDLNIGAHWPQVLEQLRTLCDDVIFWSTNQTFSPLEIAVRLHHRLVSIHPFINGNGRHSRLVADLYLIHRTHSPLSWGGIIDLITETPDRAEYIAALRAADLGDYERLIRFASK